MAIFDQIANIHIGCRKCFCQRGANFGTDPVRTDAHDHCPKIFPVQTGICTIVTMVHTVVECGYQFFSHLKCTSIVRLLLDQFLLIFQSTPVKGFASIPLSLKSTIPKSTMYRFPSASHSNCSGLSNPPLPSLAELGRLVLL